MSRPDLDLLPAIEVLHRHQVRWVMTGSLVLAAYGARLIPGDLDITPALDPGNLEAIATVVSEVEAIPLHDPDWPKCPPLDWHYRWSPRPASVENLDHLMVTTVGRLDVVPRLCGTYEELAPNAVSLDVGGLEVFVADPTSVLDRLEGRTRSKDRDRQSEIQRVRDAVESGTLKLAGLDHLT
ncbi:MAG: hypothetical protein OEM39_10470 [Acidimicrobiia bacterium]|nr:hypothetical protein [Acidimicrobiia bacterium]